MTETAKSACVFSFLWLSLQWHEKICSNYSGYPLFRCQQRGDSQYALLHEPLCISGCWLRHFAKRLWYMRDAQRKVTRMLPRRSKAR